MNISLNNINKSFGSLQVLNNLSLCFDEHRTSCIMGPSGCGKTTLLHILLGLHSIDSGEITGLEDKRPAVVFQENRLLEQQDAFTNIRAVCRRPLSNELLAAEFDKIGLTDYNGKPVAELSGGMKRRVALVRAMEAGGSLVLLDEPFTGMDARTRERAEEYIRQRQNGRTLIIATHI